MNHSADRDLTRVRTSSTIPSVGQWLGWRYQRDRGIEMALLEAKITAQREEVERQQHAIDTLRRYLGDGGTIFTITRYAKSGMSRWVRVVVPVVEPLFSQGRPDIVDITYYISVVTSLRMGADGLRFGGSGFDADTDIVNHLQHVLGLEPIQHDNGWREDRITARKLATY